ncbi:histone deacetylase family protein [Tropicimonas marinistellae]|uniref:histone deacetylase family protein n=1 Tax=Tropicimonas marinistellae TaxID=1739787 RepID=UPI00082ACC88|nr:histone deacetylase family protein [Tropicimonas marinistellae]
MTTALYSHPDCLGHVTPAGHPERVARLEAVAAALAAPAFATLDRRDAPLAERSELLRAHSESYVAAIEATAPSSGGVALDADTHMVPGSLAAALRAVGANVAAVDAVLSGDAHRAFCAIRPPGHHAERSHAMGFCLFNSVAVAAKRALDHHGLTRVAVVDFDVHHGNGTQDILWDEPRVLFASTHQMPLYPGSGAPHETGAHDNIMNVPLPPGAGGVAFRQAMERQILPALEDFQPELLLISAGFDAHADDPLAQLNFTEEDFAWVTTRLCELAERHCGGRVVSTLEGGYDLEALAACVAAHVTALMERDG